MVITAKKTNPIKKIPKGDCNPKKTPILYKHGKNLLFSILFYV